MNLCYKSYVYNLVVSAAYEKKLAEKLLEAQLATDGQGLSVILFLYFKLY